MAQVFGLFKVVAALVDYIVKAVAAYRDTPEGQAEFLDIVVAYEQATGDKIGEQDARTAANDLRQNRKPAEKVVLK